MTAVERIVGRLASPLRSRGVGGPKNEAPSVNVVISAERDYVSDTKLLSSADQAHRLTERTATFYHVNSAVTSGSKDVKFGKVADVIARDPTNDAVD